MTTEVFLLQVDSYDRAALDEAVRVFWKSLELDRELSGLKVLIKPNLVVPVAPKKAACTHPEVVRALVRHLTGSRVVIGDSPGLGSTRMAASNSGVLQVCIDENVELADFADPLAVPVPDAVVCKSFPLAQAVRQADAVISVGKLKTHGLTRYTGAVKNLYGCLPGKPKLELHLRLKEAESFAGMLVDLYLAVKPVLSVVDGIVAMEGNGPRSGNPRQVGVMVAGRDGVAVDAVACSVVGIDPFDVPYIRQADRRGAGCGDLKKIKITGAKLNEVRVKNFKTIAGSPSAIRNLPPLLQKLLREQLTAHPFIHVQNCSSCAVCMKVCPANAIEMKAVAQVDFSLCIRCYCCQELCPAGAITLKRRGLGRLLR